MPQAQPPAHRRGAHRTPALTVLVTVCALVLSLWIATPAGAAGSNPRGALDSVALSSDGSISVAGWTADPDAPASSLRVNLSDNGKLLTTVIANKPRPDVAAAYPTYGSAHGFSFRLLDSDGPHQLCVLAVNLGGGSNVNLGCGTVTVQNNPIGTMSSPSVSANTVSFTGTASDPNTTTAVTVSGYLDGKHLLDVTTTGTGHGYSIAMPISEGSHRVCLYALNLAAGSNTTLGCPTVLVHNNPLGQLESASQLGTGIQVTGYAIDLNTTAPVSLMAFLDGHLASRITASLPRPDLQPRYPASGPNHGYQLTLPAATGRHLVCIWALNQGPGSNTLLGCSAVLMQNNPIGRLDLVRQVPSGVLIQGWTIDLNTTAPLAVKFQVDGLAAGSAIANLPRTDLAAPYPNSGTAHGYAMVLPIGAGKHTVCVDAINVGPGVNSRLGCGPVTVQNNPVGLVESAYQVPGGLRIAGWGLDLNSTGPISVFIFADGRYVARTSASAMRADLAGRYPTVGGAHGFSLLAPVGPGRHSICAYLINVGPGGNAKMPCRTVTLTDLPLGRIDSVQQVPGGARMTGWAMDAFVANPLAVRTYVDGKIAAITIASAARPDLFAQYPNMGAGHGFTAFVPMPPGTHTVCLYAINPRHASNLTLSCRAVTRNVNPTGPTASIARVGLSDDIAISGWALDPDLTGAISLQVLSDGVLKQTIVANRGNVASTTAWPNYGYTHGYTSTLTLGSDEHRVCVVATNAGLGSNVTLGCTLITTSGMGAPAMPVAVSAWAGSHSVTLSWVAPLSQRAVISKYLVTVVQRGTVITVGGTATGAVANGLTNGGHYTFTIRAVNSFGAGSAALAGATPTNIPPQVTPAPVSTSHYLRNLTGNLAGDAALMRTMGAIDASHNPSGHNYLVLLQIGGQDEINQGALLSATSRFVTYAGVVSAVRAYLDGYAANQRPYAPLTLAIGTNNDVDVNATAGISWARNVVGPVVVYAASHHPGMTIAGANDMEPGFSASVAQTRSWLAGYLSATGAPFVFNGSADGCSTGVAGGGCNNGWRMSDLQWLSGGAAPTRTISLPQIYNYAMPLQWKYISLTGTSAGRPRIYFGGPLTEQTACVQTHSCGSISNTDAWSKLWSAISSSPATKQFQMPHGTDLRIN